MGSRQLSAMRDEVRLRLGNRTDIDSFIDTWIRDAYRDICNLPSIDPRITHPALEAQDPLNVTQGVRTYDLSTLFPSLWTIVSVRIVTPGKEMWMEKGSIKRFDRTNYPTSRPSRWIRYGSNLELDTVPDDNYTLMIRYLKRPSGLAFDGDVTEIDDIWDEVIVLGATWRGFDALLDHERAGMLRRIWEAIITGKVGPGFVEEPLETFGIEPSPQYLR